MKQQNGFQRVYLWAMNLKLYMGLYSFVLVLFVGALTALTGGDSLRLWTLLQIGLVGIGVAVLQVSFLPEGADYARGMLVGRIAVWSVLSGLLVGGVSMWCKWLGTMHSGWYVLLGVMMAIGCGAMALGVIWERERDTLHLNADLQRYQKR